MAEARSPDIPFIRIGVMHFVGSFFGLDETRLSDFYLTPQKIERGCGEFAKIVAFQKDNREAQGWEILYSALGISSHLLTKRLNETDRNFTLRIWNKIFAAQGLPLSLKVEKRGEEKHWVYYISPVAKEITDQAMKMAVQRVQNSPVMKSKQEIPSGMKTILLSEDLDPFLQQEMVSKFLQKGIQKKERILFLCANVKAGQYGLKFLIRKVGKDVKISTSTAIDNGQGFAPDPAVLHEFDILLLSVDFLSLHYLPKTFDRIILWHFSSILESAHAVDPLPDFTELSKKDGRQHPPGYYSQLWRAADVFHFMRDQLSHASEVLATGIKEKSGKQDNTSYSRNKHVQFLEKVRGSNIIWNNE